MNKDKQMPVLLEMSDEELSDFLKELGEPAFRAKQIQKWLMSGVPFEEMSNIPASLRTKLRQSCHEGYPEIVDKVVGSDGAAKYLLKLADGCTVETVLLPQSYGNTLCVSTQVGCAMGCAFCASCRDGLVRNLTAGEILGQVITVNREAGGGRQIDRVVLMGMGEPLQNYDEVMRFLRKANAPDGLGIGQRSFTLSTCGVIDGMDRLSEENFQLTLAVSLHSPFQDKRTKIMPSAKKYPVEKIVDAADRFFRKTGRRVTFEYALIRGVNDSAEDIDELARMLARRQVHVNVIPLNDTGALKAPAMKEVYAFADKLTKRGVPATVRRSMGADIAGACGQLRQRAGHAPQQQEIGV